MAAAWFDERPRQLSGLPTPTPMNSAAKSCSSSRVARASSSTTGETIKAVSPAQQQHQTSLPNMHCCNHCVAVGKLLSRAVCVRCRALQTQQLREKLNEFQAENSLLGTLVKELKVSQHSRLGAAFITRQALCTSHKVL